MAIKESTLGHAPFTYLLDICAHALRLGRPVSVAHHDSRTAVELTRRGQNAGNGVTHCAQVFFRKRRSRTKPTAPATHIRRAWKNSELVSTQARNLFLDLFARPTADSRHHDY
jgi:hypothetical protein